MAISKFDVIPKLFKIYSWNRYHICFGHKADIIENGFPWITELENLFTTETWDNSGSLELVKDMILWGGNQNDVLKNFSLGIESSEKLNKIILEIKDNLVNPEELLRLALSLPGFGLSYATKLLRFLKPEYYGALDSRIIEALKGILPTIHQNDISRIKGYAAYHTILLKFQKALYDAEIERPSFGANLTSKKWKISEIEMALFSWASTPQ